MADYRVYRLGKEGRFVGVHEVSADSDNEAILQAQKLLDGLDLEVWRGKEKIGYLRADRTKVDGPAGVADNGTA